MDKLVAINTFIQVVESEGFTKAAEILQVPKARVSQRMSDLEDNLGIRLLHRTTRVVTLTEDGKSYYEKCKSLLKELNDVESALRGEVENPSGKIKVEILSSIAHYLIVPMLHDFHKKYPNVILRIGSSDLVKNLVEEGIDCAIRGGALDDSSLISKPICNIKMGLYASSEFIKKYGIPKSPVQLKNYSRIGLFNAHNMNSFRWKLFKGENSFKIDNRPDLEFDDPEAALIACLQGLGIGIAAPFTVHEYVLSGRLIPILPEWYFEEKPLQIIYPTKKHLSIKVRSFVDWAFNILNNHPLLALTPLELSKKLKNKK